MSGPGIKSWAQDRLKMASWVWVLALAGVAGAGAGACKDEADCGFWADEPWEITKRVSVELVWQSGGEA